MVSFFRDLSASHGLATIRDVAKVTMALPGYFETVRFGPLDDYCDGSVQIPNPAKVAFDEARAIWPSASDHSVDMLVSIGSGKQGEESWSQWLTYWGTNTRKRLSEMITDDVWTADFPSSQTTTGRFVRLNPSTKVALPSDDVLNCGRRRNDMVRDSVETKTTHIDSVARRLLASSFYFQRTEKIVSHNNRTAEGMAQL